MTADQEKIIWINEYATLKATNPGNPFSVPEDYFKRAEAQIVSSVNLEILKEKPGTFLVPDNYFNDLNENIQSRIRLENLRSTPNAGFNVPDNYFDNLNLRIFKNAETQNQKVSKVFKIFSTKLYRYAVAAILCIAVGTGFFLNHRQSSVQNKLSVITDIDIENYLNLNTDIYDTRAIVENMSQDIIFKVQSAEFSNDELADYLTTIN
ncbi:MAG: hypothetical protein ACOH2A_05345 [Sphingobacteriaceae bacterium]